MSVKNVVWVSKNVVQTRSMSVKNVPMTWQKDRMSWYLYSVCRRQDVFWVVLRGVIRQQSKSWKLAAFVTSLSSISQQSVWQFVCKEDVTELMLNVPAAGLSTVCVYNKVLRHVCQFHIVLYPVSELYVVTVIEKSISEIYTETQKNSGFWKYTLGEFQSSRTMYKYCLLFATIATQLR